MLLGCYLLGGTTFPPLAMQSSFEVLLFPCPLHPFWPAQEWPAPWHDPVPLHALMPEQVTSSPPFFAEATPEAPIANMPATEAAIIAPLMFMSLLLICLG